MMVTPFFNPGLPSFCGISDGIKPVFFATFIFYGQGLQHFGAVSAAIAIFSAGDCCTFPAKLLQTPSKSLLIAAISWHFCCNPSHFLTSAPQKVRVEGRFCGTVGQIRALSCKKYA